MPPHEIRERSEAVRRRNEALAVANEQIEKTIVIIVEPLRSEACAGKSTSGQTCLVIDIPTFAHA